MTVIIYDYKGISRHLKVNKLTFPPKTSAFYRRKLAKYRGLG